MECDLSKISQIFDCHLQIKVMPPRVFPICLSRDHAFTMFYADALRESSGRGVTDCTHKRDDRLPTCIASLKSTSMETTTVVAKFMKVRLEAITTC